MGYPVALFALVLGLVVGEMFPDLDQRTDLLLHRSVLTHGLLLPLALYLVTSRTQSRIVRWLVMGISLGVAVHLAFDLFPRAWQGYALVSLPIHGWLPPEVSRGWIAVSVCVCLYLAEKLVHNGLEAAVFTLGLIGVFAYAVPGEHALWRPIAAVVVSTVAVTCSSHIYCLGDLPAAKSRTYSPGRLKAPEKPCKVAPTLSGKGSVREPCN